MGEGNGQLPATVDPQSAAVIEEMRAWPDGAQPGRAPTAALPTDGKGVSRELQQIAELRRTDRRKYFKDENLQARERQLLDLQAEAEGKRLLDGHTIEAWERDGTGGLLLEIGEAIGDPAVVAKFDALPTSAQRHFFEGVRNGRPTIETFVGWLDRIEGRMTLDEVSAVAAFAERLSVPQKAAIIRAVCRPGRG